MKAEPYACECGSTMFVRFSGNNQIFCKKCGKAVPKNVVFKEEFGQMPPDSHVL